MSFRPTPRERVAKHLRDLGYDVEGPDIYSVPGGKYKVLQDVIECWRVTTRKLDDWRGTKVEIASGQTLSACAAGIVLEPNTPNSDLYGDLIAHAKPKVKHGSPA